MEKFKVQKFFLGTYLTLITDFFQETKFFSGVKKLVQAICDVKSNERIF